MPEFDDGAPIFVQLAERIEREILSGAIAEEDQVPSTNEYAAFHRINPATAGKGVNLLVEEGVLYKKRGIGMFVARGARERIAAKRREAFRMQYIAPLISEARALGIDRAALVKLIEQEDAS